MAEATVVRKNRLIVRNLLTGETPGDGFKMETRTLPMTFDDWHGPTFLTTS